MTPFRTSLVFIIITLVGIASTYLLEVDFAPRSVSNSFVIGFSSDQKDPPLVTEQKITSILEGALSGIEGVKEIESVSRYGGGYITLTFNNEDLHKKRLEILTAIRQVRNQLPDKIPFPSIELGKSVDSVEPLLIYSLSSTLPTNEIVEYARQKILPELGLHSGIKNIELSTDSRPVVLVTYQIERLKSLGLSPDQVLSTLRQFIFNKQLGTITSQGETKSLFVSKTQSDITELLEIPIRSGVKLNDVATVSIDDMRPSYISRLNGKNSVLIRIFAHEHENKPELAKALKMDAVQIQDKLPDHLKLDLSYDDTEYITKELNKIAIRASLSILILSVLVLIVYRRISQLIVLIGSVVVSLGISALFMYLIGVSVHLYTIAGLTISFGLVIDNSIMVIDHLRRKNNLRIITALLAATLTTMAALLVIFILPNEDRIGMSDFAFAIIIALGSSIIVSLLFTPAFSSLVGIRSGTRKISMRSKRIQARIQQAYFRGLVFLGSYKKWVLTLMILLFGLPVYLIPKNIDGADFFNKTIGSDYYQESIRPTLDKLLGGTLRSFYLNVFESSGYRTPEKTKLYVAASLDEGHTIEQMNLIIRNVEKFLDKVDGLDSYRTNVYSGNYAQVVIEFDEASESGSLPYSLKNRLIQRSLDWGGVNWAVFGVGRGFSNVTNESLPTFRVALKGYNYADLEKLAKDLAAKLLTHPRIKEVNTNDRISWRDKSSEQLVLSPGNQIDVDTYLTTLRYVRNVAPSRIPDSYVTIGNSPLPLMFSDEHAEQFSIHRLMNEGGVTLSGTNTNLTREVKSSALYRENRQYVRVLSFEYYGSYRFGNEYLNQVIEGTVFPPGYSYEYKERFMSPDKTKRQYSLLLLVLLVIYIICTVTFESVRMPFHILLIIPLAFIGIFVTFSWGGFPFDQGGYAAFILLAGIVVNAAIFISNEASHYHSRNSSRNLVKACSRKFLPIMLTIISTCLGLTPFLMDGEKEVFWFSFAVGVIGGLFFSVFLVFVIFPALLIRSKQTN